MWTESVEILNPYEALNGCEERANKWFEEIHEEPMPELKVGMFVRADDGYSTNLGIIINNKYTKDLAVAYESGGYDPIVSVKIQAIYNTVCFNFCDDDTCVWRRSE